MDSLPSDLKLKLNSCPKSLPKTDVGHEDPSLLCAKLWLKIRLPSLSVLNMFTCRTFPHPKNNNTVSLVLEQKRWDSAGCSWSTSEVGSSNQQLESSVQNILYMGPERQDQAPKSPSRHFRSRIHLSITWNLQTGKQHLPVLCTCFGTLRHLKENEALIIEEWGPVHVQAVGPN